MSNTLLQPAAFLAMAYGGVITGVLYDFFRLLRRLIARPFFGAFFDALFVLCFLLTVAVSLLFASGGDVRPYLLLGLAAGFLLQQWSLSRIFFQLFYSLRTRLSKK